MANHHREEEPTQDDATLTPCHHCNQDFTRNDTTTIRREPDGSTVFFCSFGCLVSSNAAAANEARRATIRLTLAGLPKDDCLPLLYELIAEYSSS